MACTGSPGSGSHGIKWQAIGWQGMRCGMISAGITWHGTCFSK
jgi:hypothetical protein